MEYGRLIVLGYSSYRVEGAASSSSSGSAASGSGDGGATQRQPSRSTVGEFWEPIGDQNAQYTLIQRKLGNGIKLRRFHHFYDAKLDEEPKEKPLKIDLKTVARRMMLAIEKRNRDEKDADEWVAVNADTSAVITGEKKDDKTHLLCVPMANTDAHASVVEYIEDETTDMFQIGRMPCYQNDVVIPGPRVGASGTISRFAARIVCSREAPYECRLYAGGFDSGRRMTTAGHSLKRCASCGNWLKHIPAQHECVHDLLETKAADRVDNQHKDGGGSKVDGFRHVAMELDDPQRIPIDGLTKNGVRVWLPEPKQWFEVSVNGNLYAIAPREPSKTTSQRSANNPFMSVRHSAFNRPTGGVSEVPSVLPDGAIIDMGGVWLQFQSPWGNQRSGEDSILRASISVNSDATDHATTKTPTESSLASKLDQMNVHCPVQLHPLRFLGPDDDGDVQFDHVPHVFPSCGHVFGYDKRIAASRMCPLCRHPGSFVRLLLKENFQLLSRAERQAVPECVFNPCGHAISNKLATHYSSLIMPNGRAICPFCAVHLDPKTPYSKLYLYSEQPSQSSGEGSSGDDTCDSSDEAIRLTTL